MKPIHFCLAWITFAIVGSAHAGVYDEMIVAARNDDSEKAITLLQRGMDINTADQDGTTLAMYAARSGNNKFLEYLLNNRANILIKNRYGDTAILLAAFLGHLECVKLLVKAGAEINPQSGGWTPLGYAAFAGKADIVSYLIEQGAQVDLRAPNGMTPLMLAARNGFAEVAQYLKDKNANVGLTTAEGKTALEIAREANQLAVVSVLTQSSRN